MRDAVKRVERVDVASWLGSQASSRRRVGSPIVCSCARGRVLSRRGAGDTEARLGEGSSLDRAIRLPSIVTQRAVDSTPLTRLAAGGAAPRRIRHERGFDATSRFRRRSAARFRENGRSMRIGPERARRATAPPRSLDRRARERPCQAPRRRRGTRTTQAPGKPRGRPVAGRPWRGQAGARMRSRAAGIPRVRMPP